MKVIFVILAVVGIVYAFRYLGRFIDSELERLGRQAYERQRDCRYSRFR
jgi:hypothetical protein